MKRKSLFLLSLLLAFVVVFSSCKKEESINEALVLTEYVENSVITPATLNSLITASDLHAANQLGTVYIIDIRSAEDYYSGHIKNAVNVSFDQLLTHVSSQDLSGYDKIVIVCYTGQTAAYAVTLLRLSGYMNAASLKFGMSSWHPDFDHWTANTSNTYYSQFETTANSKGAEGPLPTLATGKETGQEILESRVATVLSEGFGAAKITAANVFDNLSNYYIVNYWPEADYLDPGHIPGAIDYIPGSSMTLDTDLKTLPTDKPIVIYCYTGQGSAFLSAYLRVLGYDARSLLFGANSMIYDHMPKSKWSPLTDGYDYDAP